MEYSTKFDFKKNELFTPAADYHFNACVCDNGGPYDLANYTDGFFDGGHVIVKAVRGGNYKVDVLVYPAVLSYRHGIELYLKHLYQPLAEWSRALKDCHAVTRHCRPDQQGLRQAPSKAR